MNVSLLSIVAFVLVTSSSAAQPQSDVLSEELATRLVGTYDFERATPYGSELRVLMIDGALRVRLGREERPLVPAVTGRVALDRQSRFRLYEFAIAGRPDELLQFEVMDQQVSRMNYLNRTAMPARVYTGRPAGQFRTGPAPVETPSDPPQSRAVTTRDDATPSATRTYTLPKDVALLLIGSYGLSGATPAGLREVHVSLANGKPQVRLGSDEHLLQAQGVEGDVYRFTVDRKPGLLVGFRITGGQVSSLQYTDRSVTPPVQLTGMPK